MYVYLALTLIVVFLRHRTGAPNAARKAGWVLIACIVIQWALGVTQFYLHIPRWTVPFHVGMSSVVTAFTALLWAHGLRRVRTTDIASSSATQTGVESSSATQR